MPGLWWLWAACWNDGTVMTAPEANAVHEVVTQLEALGAYLARRGFETRMACAGHRLNVANRATPEICQDIDAAPTDDGTWWFWWSWGDRIAPVTDLETAAFKIAYVLTPTQT